ncbi:hypothetical protein KM914_18475 [Virgibacillus pantothenticus]|nr:IS110 family transposase [Virgibacillus pantothenticus]MBU8568366.1 hypothetical protein [Virgibacillus pantothenticus]MBU8642014.1 hypothetical protein [Virgibacillus pantothenticus]MBU8645797.1 hypothetical protein [Virgibacillus pantothenticus]MBU8659343.1 hypothetical protein [Virgibacillus pantothenticus]MBU8667888.1 hypothetical protein [Virgibacillus pantothenticus]
MDKTDEIDAFVIADYLQFGRLPLSVVKEEQFIATIDTCTLPNCSANY